MEVCPTIADQLFYAITTDQYLPRSDGKRQKAWKWISDPIP